MPCPGISRFEQVPTGAGNVRVTKDGFAPGSSPVTVTANQRVDVIVRWR